MKKVSMKKASMKKASMKKASMKKASMKKSIDVFSCIYNKETISMISQWHKINHRQNMKNKRVCTPRPTQEKEDDVCSDVCSIAHQNIVRNQDDHTRLEFERSDLQSFLDDEIACNRSIENTALRLKQLNIKMTEQLSTNDEEPIVLKPLSETKKLKKVVIKPLPTLSIPRVINGKIAVRIKT